MMKILDFSAKAGVFVLSLPALWVGYAFGGVALQGLRSGEIQSVTTAAPSSSKQTLEDHPGGSSLASATADAVSSVEFSFHAFGDSGWADSHVARPSYQAGFKKAYARFDPTRALIGDINYVNWETTVGNSCDVFWAPPGDSAYAFLTPPEDLEDAIGIGFNLIGLANNHSYDCARSAEGVGPLQTLGHVKALQERLKSPEGQPGFLYSGVFLNRDQEPQRLDMPAADGRKVPVRFLSAYVGGDLQHCRQMLCHHALPSYEKAMAGQPGLRVLALHSWNASSHQQLIGILRSWLKRGLVDVAIGSGPHVAEAISVIPTPRGPRVLATSLGNFVHPSLSSQPNNVVLRTDWVYGPTSATLQLRRVRGTVVSCDAENCRAGLTSSYPVPSRS